MHQLSRGLAKSSDYMRKPAIREIRHRTYEVGVVLEEQNSEMLFDHKGIFGLLSDRIPALTLLTDASGGVRLTTIFRRNVGNGLKGNWRNRLGLPFKIVGLS